MFTGTNQHGYWFKWNDRYGQGNLQLREYTDGSLRGIIYIDDGTMLGKKLGEFHGFRKWVIFVINVNTHSRLYGDVNMDIIKNGYLFVITA